MGGRAAPRHVRIERTRAAATREPPAVMCAAISDLMDRVVERDPDQSEFHQAVREVLESIVPVANAHPEMLAARVLERLLEPDRSIRFRVTWEDDDGDVHVNRGWRVQHSNALGPYKGGLRFHPSVSEGVLKFLSFEQIFKNALTGLPLGAGKGGADFDPRGRSDREVMRFCASFMSELYRHVGPETDVPAGDIGVGAREVGFLAGQYRRLVGEWTGVVTGKPTGAGGIVLRTEATGYGAVLFADAALQSQLGDGLKGKRALVSGAGNVALHAAELLIERGATVVTLSDSGGLLRASDGLSAADLERVSEVKSRRGASLAEAADGVDGLEFVGGAKPWADEGDIAFPCATQNELGAADAASLVENGVRAVVEGANMPCTSDATRALREGAVIHLPGKAANAGGVAVSGLEMAQNAGKHPWTRERVEDELRGIVSRIHAACVDELRTEDGPVPDYRRAADVAGFRRVAAAMVAAGLG